MSRIVRAILCRLFGCLPGLALDLLGRPSFYVCRRCGRIWPGGRR